MENQADSKTINLPAVKLAHFEGPLDLLFHLIEKNDMDIYDIRVSEITEQYMAYLDNMKKLDMEVASEFLVMAATLVHIKSRMLLPGRKTEDSDDTEDPREELVVSLLRYKRCRQLSLELKERHEKFSGCFYRMPSTAAKMGVEIIEREEEFNSDMFDQGVEDICERNKIRFNDISSKITNILRRDRMSVRERVKTLFKQISERRRVFFHELFEKDKDEKIDRVVSFLAVLELLKSNKINAEQKKPFDVILLEKKGET